MQLESDTTLESGETTLPEFKFPLAFTPFERLMLLDNRPDYPMTIHVRLDFASRLLREPLLAAAQEAVARHPLLGAYCEWKGRWPWWMGKSTSPVPVEWLEEEPSEHSIRPSYIDLFQGTGVRLVVQAGVERSSMVVLVHHSCCDGQAVRRFVFDLMSAYDRIALGENSQRISARFDALRHEKLMARHEFAAKAAPDATQASDASNSFWQRTRHALGFVLDRPQPLAGPQRTAERVGPGSAHHYVFDIEETANFRRRAQEEDATFNDVAVAKLMQILVAWNRQHEKSSDRNFVRVCVPTDLRGKADDNSPATNRMGYAFLTRRFGQMDEWSNLLSGIRDETTYIKDNRVGLDFVTNISIAQAVPLVLPMALKYLRCFTTATLTNLGDATRRLRRRFPLDAGRMVVGGAPIDAIHVTPPVRPGTRAGFGMVVSGGRLSVSLLTDPHLFDDDDTRAILNSYVEALQTWSQGRS